MPSFVTLNDRICHYAHRPGSPGRRAIVFVNSLGTDMRIWDGVIAELAPDIPMVRYDKSGHGLSGEGAVSIADLAADLAALLDHLGIRDALICGVSIGGLIAQELAARRPDQVTGLMLCNTGAKIGTAEVWNPRIDACRQGGIEAIADGVLERWFATQFRCSNAGDVAGYRLMLTRTPVAGYIACCIAIRDADLSEQTRALSVPTRCIAGSEDQATPPELVAQLAGLIEGATCTVYEGVGHLPCLDAPSRLAADIASHYEWIA